MARHRGPPWRLIAGVFVVVTIVSVTAAFFSGPAYPAPKDPGVCWQVTYKGDKPGFQPLGRDVLNLESCAAYLERLFLRDGGQVTGAYQGRYLFVDDDAIKSATSLEGSRWRVFFNPQRTALDQKLRQSTGRPPSIVTAPAS